MRYIAMVFLLGLVNSAWSEEGMWTLDNPPLKAMQRDIGWAPSQNWLDKVMRGSARIAIGCSASFVSKNGLVLTNHHCVARCAEQLSNAQRDLLQAGFLATDRANEQRCPAMEVNRLETISDVTTVVTKATAGLDGTAFKLAQNAIKAKLTSSCVGSEGNKVRCDVIDLYHGGQYKLYRYRRFQDVRLVFAPEQAVAFFGGDPDNFNFPRYDLDMSLIRIYEDGKPAVVNDYFPLSATGPAAGEPVFVSGHPGSTERELTVAEIAGIRDYVLLDSVLRLAEYRGVLTQFRTTSAESARIAAAELFYVENSLKASRGKLNALLDPALFQRKIAAEAALRSFVASKPALAATTAGAWDAIAQAEKKHRNLFQPREQIEGGRGFACEYFRFARTLVRGAAERPKENAERLPEFNDNVLPQVEANLFSNTPIYPELEKVKLTFALTKLREALGTDAPFVQRVLGKQSPEQLAKKLIEGARLGDTAVRRQLWDGGAAAIAASDDPFIRLVADIDSEARALRSRQEKEVEAVVQKNTELIAAARFARAGDTTYPDATFTLRLSYGVVKGWNEADQLVAPFTQFSGAFERATGSAPFALPASWLASKNKLELTTPLNFVSTNDIIGGNSGSPVLNRNGELVGLIFDGNIHSLGGAYSYDPNFNRSVSVDSAGILEALDKIYGAKALVSELRSTVAPPSP
jgi:hypothetical protein